jgi:hypothetical protein
MSLGLLILLIFILGYLSNWLNWRYLNYAPIKILYYLGAAVHEISHALFCVFCGAKITEFSIFSRQPHVIYQKPKIPVLGNFLISLAPISGGLAFIFLLNKFFLENYFTWPFSLAQINLLEWQSWLMVFLSFNMGAMIGPSFLDLKNIWPVLLLCFFINWPILATLSSLIFGFMLANIAIQLILILILKILKILTHHNFTS